MTVTPLTTLSGCGYASPHAVLTFNAALVRTYFEWLQEPLIRYSTGVARGS